MPNMQGSPEPGDRHTGLKTSPRKSTLLNVCALSRPEMYGNPDCGFSCYDQWRGSTVARLVLRAIMAQSGFLAVDCYRLIGASV